MFAATKQLATSAAPSVKGSVVLDGSGDSLTVANNSVFNLGSFTVEAWVNFTAVSGRFNFIFDYLNSAEDGWFFRYVSSGALRFKTSNGFVDATWTATLGQWYHVAATRDGSNNIRVFVDGSMMAGPTTISGGTTQTANPLRIGGSSVYGSDTYGYISNARIIAGSALYTSSFTKPTTPLSAVSGTALLTCQSPTTITDASTNNFTVTLNGNAAANSLNPF